MPKKIENVSTGRRGSICCEYLLKAGYKVVFFTRDTGCRPFLRKIS